MSKRRGGWAPEEVLCHWCREPGHGRSPYNTPVKDALSLLWKVCGEHCPKRPVDAGVFYYAPQWRV